MSLELSSDETSVLDLIMPTAANTPQKRALSRTSTRPKRTKPISKKHFYDSSEDEFAVELPSVFQIDAKHNEKLVKNSHIIEKTIAEDAAIMKRQYAQLIDQKEALLAELNDNGSDYKYLLSNEHHKRLVDTLVKLGLQRKGPFLASRHFYFYGELKEDPTLDTTLPFNPRSSLFRLQFRRQNYGRLRLFLKDHFWPFLHHILASETDVRFLLLVGDFVKSLKNTDIPLEIDSAQFSRYVDLLGGDPELLSPTARLPIKLVQYHNSTRLLYARLAILFFSVFLGKFDAGVYFTLLRVFILTLSDFNLVRKDTCGFMEVFVGPVFGALVEWRRKGLTKPPLEQHDTLILELHSMLSDIFVTRFHSSPDSPSPMVSYQLHFNVLRLLAECTGGSDDLFLVRLVASLNMSFINGKEYFFREMTPAEKDLESANFDFTPSPEALIAVFQKVKKLNVTKALEQNTAQAINRIFIWPYRLRALNLVVFKTFWKNLNSEENRRNHREITQANYDRLSKLNQVVKTARDRFHSHLGQVLHAETPEDSIYEKEDVVATITESYYVLNELSATITKDVRLVHEDMFYDGVEG